jgi:hypothetical protein
VRVTRCSLTRFTHFMRCGLCGMVYAVYAIRSYAVMRRGLMRLRRRGIMRPTRRGLMRFTRAILCGPWGVVLCGSYGADLRDLRVRLYMTLSECSVFLLSPLFSLGEVPPWRDTSLVPCSFGLWDVGAAARPLTTGGRGRTLHGVLSLHTLLHSPLFGFLHGVLPVLS